jgi:class 3 adenylate cyclase
MFNMSDARVGDLDKLETDIGAYLDSHKIGYAYGALAAGVDILIAETLLARGIELHIILPCPPDHYKAVSVTPSGAEWEDRFDACLKRATTIRTISHDDEAPDPLMIAYGSEVAMGLAVLKAQQLATSAAQLLIWDGEETGLPAGTAHDGARWRKTGRPQTIIDFPFDRLAKKNTDSASAPVQNQQARKERSMRALIFADFKGFASLRDSQIPLFQEQILTPMAEACSLFSDHILHTNTWGDGLFFVLDGVECAAAVSLKLRESFEAIDLSALGLTEQLALRVGCHYGPIYTLADTFTKSTTIVGSQVTLAAKIEPVTTPGSIYVSEPFACALALLDAGQYAAEQMSDSVQLHKSADHVSLFSLRRKGQQ